MNCWEALHIQVFHHHKILIIEQQVSDTNLLYELANTARIHPQEPQLVFLSAQGTTHIQTHGKHNFAFSMDCLFVYYIQLYCIILTLL
jgi:hypothetical protein